jgi:hypothetical protein
MHRMLNLNKFADSYQVFKKKIQDFVSLKIIIQRFIKNVETIFFGPRFLP